MRAKDIIAVLVAIPTLALFGGVGAIAWQVGQTWTSADTQSLISATAAVCGGGAVVVGVMLALVVGVPLALRAYGEAGRAQRECQAVAQQRRGRCCGARSGHHSCRKGGRSTAPGTRCRLLSTIPGMVRKMDSGNSEIG
jgi:hypothetical protein